MKKATVPVVRWSFALKIISCTLSLTDPLAQNFTANQFRLFLHSLAYILIHTLQKEVLKGSEYANATMKTIQLKIIKTAAWVKEMTTKKRIELPKFCPTRNEQIKGFEMLIMLRT